MLLLATSEDLRNYLNAEDIDRARADFILGGISDEIRKFSGQSFELIEDDTITLDGSGHSVLLIPKLPVLDISAITEGGTELDESAYEWSSTGILKKLDGSCWAQRFRNVVVTFTHGHEQVPEDVRLLVCRVASRAVVNPTATATEAMGGYSAGYGFDTERKAQLTESDRDILRPYMGR